MLMITSITLYQENLENHVFRQSSRKLTNICTTIHHVGTRLLFFLIFKIEK
jgi:hypothetical protein